MILLFLPFINHHANKSEHKMKWQEAVVIAYSGIRGAFPLIICLTIVQNPNYDTNFKYITSLVTVGVIFLGIIFNGLTIKFLIQWLNIIQPNLAENSLKKRVLSKINDETAEKVALIKQKVELVGANWRIVNFLTEQTPLEIEHNFRETITANFSSIIRRDTFINSNTFEVEGEIRLRIIYFIKAEIVKGVKESECSSEAASILTSVCEYSEETSMKGMDLWPNLEKILNEDWIIWISERLKTYKCLEEVCRNYRTTQKCVHFECVFYFLQLIDKAILAKENLIPLCLNITKFLENEIAEYRKSAEIYVENLNSANSGLFQLYKTKKASKEILQQRLKIIRRFYKEGLVLKEVLLLGVSEIKWHRKKKI